MNTALGTNEVVSEIWEFTLVDPGSESGVVEVDSETVQALVQLIGQDTYNVLLKRVTVLKISKLMGKYIVVWLVSKILSSLKNFKMAM